MNPLSSAQDESGPSDLASKLDKWVEESGRALELRTARAFHRGRATSVHQSFAYTDPNSELQREGDVLANFDWNLQVDHGSGLLCTLRTVVECKSSRAKPWVAFDPAGGLSSTEKLTDWLVRAWAPWTPAIDLVEGAWRGHAPFDDAPVASHVVAAVLGQKGEGKESEKNDANDAVRQVLSAAIAIGERDRVASNSGDVRGTFILAAVVTEAPLFTCFLDESGAIQLRPTDRFTVRMNRGKVAHRVHVLNENMLPEFVRLNENLVSRVSRD